jgi:hypothetical protein
MCQFRTGTCHPTEVVSAEIVVCRAHTLVCNCGDRRSNAQDAAISGERFSPSNAIHPATKRHVRPAGDQDEDFAPELFSSAAPTD